MNPKQGKDNFPEDPNHYTMYKSVIYIFLFTVTQKTAIRKLPPSFFKPIQGEDLPPRSLPSKKSSFSWDLVHPNALIQKGEGIGSNQQIVSIPNPKSALTPTFP